MAPAVEFYGLLEVEVGGESGVGGEGGAGFGEGGVEVGDVGCVVFGVVELHYLGGDGGFEGVVGVGEGGEGIGGW